ncbi:MAG: hypothetical protein COW67_09565 [Flavobacteriales bacterium CG18_big_fil_WC_8_21_14_2_50_32_9]|nr:hypothetical protein [Flavobacteriales bacterium]PIQ15216.1 MAG: hypothetical protein COW67_09565 [Flavobacteriales bacterium CG18_big_fil_WC_8_21_14_2_50_32_9]PJC62659.1 MAG: hypothetical protein CO022_03350 [Flavobacteriales bacterium CG_4_9_14_0_2_um_filter_32_27]
MIKKLSFSFLLSLIFFCGYSQNFPIAFQEDMQLLNSYGKEIIESKTDELKEIANNHFKETLLLILKNDTSFEIDFSGIEKISVLKENNLKIYNWTLPHTNGTFTYFAFLQLKLINGTFKLVELIDKSDEIEKIETKTLSDKMWYGALYYTLIHEKKLGENYYTVLGWDGNNLLTNKKIIDVIVIDDNGNIKLGAPIFKMEKKTQRRVIFEYGKEFSMSLKYDSKNKRIIFDYLVPASSKLKGVYEYYGPSLDTFDALVLTKNKWQHFSKIDVKLEKTKKDKDWNDPLK